MSGSDSKPTTSDAELIESARSGDTSAFGELWLRHYRPAARVARQFTSIDADDLVSEAYARIFQRVLAGGGPTGAFRPYLYTTIRNLASTWGAASRDIQVDMIEDFEDERIPDDPAAWALDRTLTASAFRGLPERWQTVLWYTEVEGMDPHEVAPIMGITANSVAALSYRAREGLRKAWLQAHISDATASGECQWTMAHLGDHTRNGLSARDAERMTDHLEDCAKCTIVSEEVDEVGSHLAMVMLPLLLGGIAGGTLLSQLAAAVVVDGGRADPGHAAGRRGRRRRNGRRRTGHRRRALDRRRDQHRAPSSAASPSPPCSAPPSRSAASRRPARPTSGRRRRGPGCRIAHRARRRDRPADQRPQVDRPRPHPRASSAECGDTPRRPARRR